VSMATPKKDKIEQLAKWQNFSVVGIGVSAGGLEAFKQLLIAIPENSGMAYLLVQHHDSSHPSFLIDILQRATKIPVKEITNTIHIAPDTIFIIPANKILTSTNGALQLSPRKNKTFNLTIDIFLTSLAHVYKEFAVGIVLSGIGSDGTLGLKAIKEHGGITFAQDSESSEYNNMPQNAMDAGVVDFVLAPKKILEQLLQINRVYNTGNLFQDNELVKKSEEEIFKKIILLLRHRTGVDFSLYKQPTFHRRIARRVAVNNKNNLSEYLEFLSTNHAEQDNLFQDVLIPVTSFFRDEKTFLTLSDILIPAIFKNKAASEATRVWVAGCSTGEEAYSIAICLLEFLGEKSADTKIQVFASDISEKVLKKARTAIFNNANVKKIPEKLLKKYFLKTTNGYELTKTVRDLCVFAPHNFLKDPPFAKMDLISCRNVFIYMGPLLHEKALRSFHYSLNEKGFLILGKSETIGAYSNLFSHFVKSDKIYSRKPGPGRFMHIAKEPKEESFVTKENTLVRQETSLDDFQISAEQFMILKSPSSVIVNEQMDITHIHGDITPFLHQPQGKPTHNIIKMAREGLAFELRNAIQTAKSNKESTIKENIALISDGGNFLINIEVTPLTKTAEPHFLIQFKKIIVSEWQLEKNSSSGEADYIKTRNDELEKQLSQTRKDIESVTADMESTNEELQSGNEELLSSNEEMQSLNIELEISREKLQSTNQELIIVNQELIEKQEQLNETLYYAESIFTTIREPLIILDGKLCIKTANASFYKKFNIKERETEGKLFFEIQNHQWDDHHIRSLLEKILREKECLTDFEIVLKFPVLGERTMLMNVRQIVNEKTAEQLLLLAIEDVTERKVADHKIKTFTDELEKKVIERTAELKLSIEDLKQTNLHLDQFAHAASHDLQEPLRKILTFSMRLQNNHKDELSTEVISYLHKIEAASNRMTALIKDLLNYSRLFHHENSFSKTDLNDTLNNNLIDFELLIEEKKAEIVIAKLPTLEAIPFQMSQLFHNLISNSLKFSKEGVPPVISITYREFPEKEIEKYAKLKIAISYVEIIFRDNGIGFEQKYADQIFTIFQRIHNKESYSGTGIGLALCKKIIENHQGEIFVWSKENEGTVFHIILPLKNPH
jgi:two-component system CheB/CheR fusion protein